MCGPATSAVSGKSRTTRAVTGTVPSAAAPARAAWLEAQRAELLPVPYFHLVFTLPHQLAALALSNRRLLYDLLFRAATQTLCEIAADQRHLGARIGGLWCCTPGDRTWSIIRTCMA